MKNALILCAAALSTSLALPAARAGSCAQNDAACLLWTETGTRSIAIVGEARGSGKSYGVEGSSHVNDATSAGVHGYSEFSNGVYGEAPANGLNGVQGTTARTFASGVFGYNSSGSGYGVAGRAIGSGIAVYGDQASATGWAGYFNGSVYTTGTYSSSDARLKRDIQDLHHGVGDVLKLRPVTFKWNNRNDDRTHIGLIAQEVQQIVPEIVTTAGPAGSDTLAVNYTALIPVMIKALQEQQAVIDRQNDRIATLEKGRPTVASSLFSDPLGRNMLLGLLPLGLVVAFRKHQRDKKQ